jgi:hypothetical protein
VIKFRRILSSKHVACMEEMVKRTRIFSWKNIKGRLDRTDYLKSFQILPNLRGCIQTFPDWVDNEI